MKTIMKKTVTLTLAAVMLAGMMTLTASAAVPPGCPSDGQGMDTIWGNKHMEIARQIVDYAKSIGWTGGDYFPQGWSNYEKVPGPLSLDTPMTYINKDGHWWKLYFKFLDDTFTVVLRYYYFPGVGNVGELISEEPAGNGSLTLDELKSVVDKYTALKISGATPAPMPTPATTAVNIQVNGQALSEAAAYIKNDKTVAPIAIIAGAFGFEIGWDGVTKTATLTKDAQVIKIVIGNDTISYNGQPQTASVTPYIDPANNRTYAAIADIAQLLGINYTWDGNTRTVNFTL